MVHELGRPLPATLLEGELRLARIDGVARGLCLLQGRDSLHLFFALSVALDKTLQSQVLGAELLKVIEAMLDSVTKFSELILHFLSRLVLMPINALIRIIFLQRVGFVIFNAGKHLRQLLSGERRPLLLALRLEVLLALILTRQELLVELKVPGVHLFDDS